MTSATTDDIILQRWLHLLLLLLSLLCLVYTIFTVVVLYYNRLPLQLVDVKVVVVAMTMTQATATTPFMTTCQHCQCEPLATSVYCDYSCYYPDLPLRLLLGPRLLMAGLSPF